MQGLHFFTHSGSSIIIWWLAFCFVTYAENSLSPRVNPNLWRVIVTIHELLPDDLVADLEILFEFLLFDEFEARPVDRVKFF
jgi:hypothetical protein